MKQLLQNMKDGKTSIEEVPIPMIRPNTVLVKISTSLVSAGTERMVVEFAEKNLLEKAASRPDLVRQVISKAQREGLLSTFEAVVNKLDQPMALGYSSAGTVIEIGTGVENIKPGDRVACAGGGYAVHAEYNIVPKNLVASLPENVTFESAAFATLGAIALQGFRLSEPQIGETVGVIGLGLLGLLAVQIAAAAGCQVFGIDISPARVELAKKIGIEAVVREGCTDFVSGFTKGMGFDHVLICADTSSNDPVELAGQIARDRGTVVAVGAVGFDIPRKIYYSKELDFKVSRSYGPGRYDPQYEEAGIDYPVGYVRWTEGRNISAFIDLLGSKKVDVAPLISHRFAIAEAEKAYHLITGKTKEPFLGVVLIYPDGKPTRVTDRKIHTTGHQIAGTSDVKVGVLGAGNYAQSVFLPILKKVNGAELIGIASASGLSAKHATGKFGFGYATSSDEEVLKDPNINTIVILTRHNLHAHQVLLGLQNKKAVYCEKPLALNPKELTEIQSSLSKPDVPLLTVGFNRRFAPFSVRLKEFFKDRGEPMMIHYRVNAGFLPLTHWLHDPAQGGGRIIGEGCHFIDFITFIIGVPPIFVSAVALDDQGKYHQDNVSMTFSFPDGSVGIVEYLANGNKNSSKERIEAFSGGRIGILSDFRSLELITETTKHTIRSILRQDKGHTTSWQTFVNAVIAGGPPPIPYDHLLGVTNAGFAAVEAIQTRREIKI